MVVCISEMAFILGVSTKTLRRWDNGDWLSSDFRSLGGHRRYVVSRVLKFFGICVDSNDGIKSRFDIVYSRVSSYHQKPDLERQTERMREYIKELSPSCVFISDIGSGLNYNKKGLLELIRMIASGNVNRIFISHRDRLLRFGYQLIEYFASLFNSKIIYVDHEAVSEEENMALDIMSIIHVFSSRMNGRRSHSHSKKTKNKENNDEKSKEIIQ